MPANSLEERFVFAFKWLDRFDETDFAQEYPVTIFSIRTIIFLLLSLRKSCCEHEKSLDKSSSPSLTTPLKHHWIHLTKCHFVEINVENIEVG